MNNENNNVNTEPVVNQVPTTPVVPNTTPVVANPVSEPKAKSKTGIRATTETCQRP